MLNSFKFYCLNSLTNVQRASIISSVKIFVKRSSLVEPKALFESFMAEQEYNFDINNSKMLWLKELLYEDKFQKDVLNIIKTSLQLKVYKERQKPIIAKNRELKKKFRKQAIEWRQSREKPTEKQIRYYNALCKKYKITDLNLENKSKFDLKNMIAELLERKNG